MKNVFYHKGVRAEIHVAFVESYYDIRLRICDCNEYYCHWFNDMSESDLEDFHDLITRARAWIAEHKQSREL